MCGHLYTFFKKISPHVNDHVKKRLPKENTIINILNKCFTNFENKNNCQQCVLVKKFVIIFQKSDTEFR